MAEITPRCVLCKRKESTIGDLCQGCHDKLTEPDIEKVILYSGMDTCNRCGDWKHCYFLGDGAKICQGCFVNLSGQIRRRRC